MQFYVTKHSFISSKHASTSIKQRQRVVSSSCSQVWAISLRYTLFPVVLCCSLTYFSISSDFFRLPFFTAFICYVSTLRDRLLVSLTGDTWKQSLHSFRYGYILARFTAHGRPCTRSLRKMV